FIKALKPDLVASGVKEKYVFQKMGLPFRQMHSWDYSEPSDRSYNLDNARFFSGGRKKSLFLA
ncbi:MAG: nitrogenase molybdenum-iron protein alpha chain, partial [Nostoc sp.]